MTGMTLIELLVAMFISSVLVMMFLFLLTHWLRTSTLLDRRLDHSQALIKVYRTWQRDVHHLLAVVSGNQHGVEWVVMDQGVRKRVLWQWHPLYWVRQEEGASAQRFYLPGPTQVFWDYGGVSVSPWFEGAEQVHSVRWQCHIDRIGKVVFWASTDD